MLRYALKQSCYSILILLGVMILTFVMFRMAAGDPTATLLGKNPTPQEVEDLRSTLGCDKPLFWGKWRRTELYSSALFQNSRTNFPGIRYQGDAAGNPDSISIAPGAGIRFQRNFESAGDTFRIVLKTDHDWKIAGQIRHSFNGLIELELQETPKELLLENPNPHAANLKEVQFFRPTASPLDSQLLASLKEVVMFTGQFPYVSFFNFGKTLQTRESIRGKLWRGMWPSLFLMLPIFFGELLIGLTLAMFSCVYHGRVLDKIILVLSVAGMSISYLALIIFGQWFMAYYLNLFPVWGWGSPKFLVLPILIGILSGTGSGVRFYRTVFLNEANKEYLRTAVAKGCSPFKVYFIHMMKNAMIPIITRASSVLPFLFTGSLLLESFFGIPGLGYEGINALNDADLQMLKALVLLGSFLFVAINLITDLAYAWVDPRVRVAR